MRWKRCGQALCRQYSCQQAVTFTVQGLTGLPMLRCRRPLKQPSGDEKAYGCDRRAQHHAPENVDEHNVERPIFKQRQIGEFIGHIREKTEKRSPQDSMPPGVFDDCGYDGKKQECPQ